VCYTVTFALYETHIEFADTSVLPVGLYL